MLRHLLLGVFVLPLECVKVNILSKGGRITRHSHAIAAIAAITVASHNLSAVDNDSFISQSRASFISSEHLRAEGVKVSLAELVGDAMDKMDVLPENYVADDADDADEDKGLAARFWNILGLAGTVTDISQAAGMMLIGSARKLKHVEKLANVRGFVNFMGWAGLASAGYEVFTAQKDLRKAFDNHHNGCVKTVRGTKLVLAAGGLGVGLLAQFALSNHTGIVAGGVTGVVDLFWDATEDALSNWCKGSKDTFSLPNGMSKEEAKDIFTGKAYQIKPKPKPAFERMDPTVYRLMIPYVSHMSFDGPIADPFLIAQAYPPANTWMYCQQLQCRTFW